METTTVTSARPAASAAFQPAVLYALHGAPPDEIAPSVRGELAAFKALVVATAEALWRRRNPDRARLPKGFRDGLALRTRAIRRGGRATLVLERPDDGSRQLLLPGAGASSGDEASAAIAILLDAIRAIGRGDPLPARFPREVLPDLGAWGKDLAPGEWRELALPDTKAPGVRYGQDERLAFLRLLDGAELDVAEYTGRVPRIRRDAFEVSDDLEAGQGVLVPLRAEHEELVLEASRTYDRVFVRGLALFDVEGRLVRFVDVETVEPVRKPEDWGWGELLWESGPEALALTGS